MQPEPAAGNAEGVMFPQVQRQAGAPDRRTGRRRLLANALRGSRFDALSHTAVDPDLENVIRQALTDAKAAGKDHLSQIEDAVWAVKRARPDMTTSDALAAVNLIPHE